MMVRRTPETEDCHMSYELNKEYLVEGVMEDYLLDPQAHLVIPGVDEVLRLGPVVNIDELGVEHHFIQATAEEAHTWAAEYKTLDVRMKDLSEREARLREFYEQAMQDIDRDRLEAWAAYEPIHHKIGVSKT